MCNYQIRHPMRRDQIGRSWPTLSDARKAALRAVRRYDHVRICHWRRGVEEIMFQGGLIITGGLLGPTQDASKQKKRKQGAPELEVSDD